MGRQKIPMEKIKKEAALQVSFSKRRFGAFKKANELVTLCGALVALIVFSPSGRPYSIGFPSVDIVLDLFLHHGLPSDFLLQGCSFLSRQLNDELMNVTSMYEQKYGQKISIANDLKRAADNINLHHSTTGRTYDGNSLPRLEQLLQQMIEVRQRLINRKSELDSEKASSSSSSSSTSTFPDVSAAAAVTAQKLRRNQPAPIPSIHPYLGLDQLRLNEFFNPPSTTQMPPSMFPIQQHNPRNYQPPNLNNQQPQPIQQHNPRNYQAPNLNNQQQQRIQQLNPRNYQPPNVSNQQQQPIQQHNNLNYQQPIVNNQQQQHNNFNYQQPIVNNQQQQHNNFNHQQPIVNSEQQRIQQANENYQQQDYQIPGGEFANMNSFEFTVNTNLFCESSHGAGPSNISNNEDINNSGSALAANSADHLIMTSAPLPITLGTNDAAQNYVEEILLNDDENLMMTEPIDAEALRRYEESLMGRSEKSSPIDLDVINSEYDEGVQVESELFQTANDACDQYHNDPFDYQYLEADDDY
ncbi:hypothetical protein ZOSMA_147G00340 [Zostera marina]|uniref:MADS-box domain-containing protein n=1 Tax=Zostera marina TaxID=29655 RepID=A0A0K9PZ56_ZOSMR|nr:hypothetical protein ZOSMA_147G00340 [Zostera marina]